MEEIFVGLEAYTVIRRSQTSGKGLAGRSLKIPFPLLFSMGVIYSSALNLQSPKQRHCYHRL